MEKYFKSKNKYFYFDTKKKQLMTVYKDVRR